MLSRSRPLLGTPLKSTSPGAWAVPSLSPWQNPPSGDEEGALQATPVGWLRPSGGQTGCTHLRNTEPGLSGMLFQASAPTLLGLPGISDRNTVSLDDDSLFFTIVDLSIAKSRNKLKGSFFNLPSNVKISAFQPLSVPALQEATSSHDS